MAFLEHQLALEREHFGNDPGAMQGEELAEYIRWNFVALHTELGEALQELDWKPWKRRGREESDPFKGDSETVDRFREELVDCYHFLGNLFLAADVDDALLDELYEGKRKVNEQRQAAR